MAGNSKMRLMFVYGTRPEFIKLVPIIRLSLQNDKIHPFVCSTGQHREMLKNLYAFFDILPDHELNIMKPDQSLDDVVSRILHPLGCLVKDFSPDVIVAQGDTSTVFAAGIVAFHHRVRLAHVEAGLRTYDLTQPWPEEGYRQMVSRIARYHFCPTKASAKNLLNEHIDARTIYVTGNPVIDSLLWTVNKLKHAHTSQVSMYKSKVDNERVVLVTAHRRESFGRGIQNICHAILELATSYPSVAFVFPVHMNPQVKKSVYNILSRQENVHLLPPLAYPDFCWWLQRATIVLTDSGGIQEEAPTLGVPVLVMRNTTERPEGIEAGCCKLVGTKKDTIVASASALLESPEERHRMSARTNPYGDGHAAKRILQILSE